MPQRSPTKLNTSRNRALDIGTEAGGFANQLPYNAQAGMPTGAGMPVGKYADPADAARARSVAPSKSQRKPFAVKG